MKKINIEEKRDELKNIIGNRKSYNYFSRNKELAFKYAKTFNIKICPYCNINYIYTVYTKDKKPVIRPDFDHFVPKTKKNQLDIDNLVPSCPVCNSRLKRDIKFSEKNNIHPFKHDFDSIVDFAIDLKSVDYLDEDNFDIIFVQNKNAKNDDYRRAKNNIDTFALKERYACHKDTVVGILEEIKYYYGQKTDEINDILQCSSCYLTKKTDRYKNIDINNVSLGKLKKDIAKKYAK